MKSRVIFILAFVLASLGQLPAAAETGSFREGDGTFLLNG